MITEVGILRLVDATPEEIQLTEDALAMLDPRVKLEELFPEPQEVRYVDKIPSRGTGLNPEGFYPRRGRVEVRRMKKKSKLNVPRMQSTLLHELGHGIDAYVIGKDKEDLILDLFEEPRPANWRAGEYWHKPYEAFCDWWVRAITNGQLVSHYEDRRLQIPADRLDRLIPIIVGPEEEPTPVDPPIPEPPPEPEPVEPEPIPEPENPPEEISPVNALTNVVELSRGTVAASTPVLHPDTLEELFIIKKSTTVKLFGETADGKYRGILARTSGIEGVNPKIALVPFDSVTNVRTLPGAA